MSDIKMPEGVTLSNTEDTAQLTNEVSNLVEKMGIGLNTKLNQKSLTIQTQELKSSNDILKVSGLNSSYLKTLNDFFSIEPQKEEERKKKEDKKDKKENEKSQNKKDSAFKQGFEKFGTKMGSVWDKNSQSIIQGMLGPLSLITAPLQDFFGFDLGSVFKGMFTKIFSPKKSKTKPTAKDVAKTGNAGSLYIVDQFQKIFGSKKKKEGGLLEKLLGGGGIFGKVLAFLPMVLAIGATLGVLLSNVFGKEGALSMFKEGNIFKGIMTLLFGKDLSGKGTLGKILGIGKIGILGASIGFMIGGPIGALIGLGIGAGAATIKLGFDSGFIQEKFGQGKDALKTFLGDMSKTDWIAGIAGAGLGLLIAPWAGPAALLGGFALGLVLKRKLSGKSAKDGKKIEKTIKKHGSSGLTNFFGKLFDGIDKFTIRAIPQIIGNIKDKIFDKFESIGTSIHTFFSTLFDDIKEGFSNVLSGKNTIGDEIKKIIKKYFIEPLTKLFKNVKDTIIGAKELGPADFLKAQKAGMMTEAVEGSQIFRQAKKQGKKDELLKNISFRTGKKFDNINDVQNALIEGLISPDDLRQDAKWAGAKIEKVNDAIIKPNGQIIRTAPDDNIIATKNDPTMVSLGGNGSSNASMDTTKLNTMNEWLGKIYNALISNQGNSNNNTMTLDTLLNLSKAG